MILALKYCLIWYSELYLLTWKWKLWCWGKIERVRCGQISISIRKRLTVMCFLHTPCVRERQEAAGLFNGKLVGCSYPHSDHLSITHAHTKTDQLTFLLTCYLLLLKAILKMNHFVIKMNWSRVFQNVNDFLFMFFS